MRAEDVSERSKVAARALDALGAEKANRRELTVNCENGHHVASIYRTRVGLVFVSRTDGSPVPLQSAEVAAHEEAVGHQENIDLLWADPLLGDDIHGWCACGRTELSRIELITQVKLGVRTFAVA